MAKSWAGSSSFQRRSAAVPSAPYNVEVTKLKTANIGTFKLCLADQRDAKLDPYMQGVIDTFEQRVHRF